MDWKEFFRPTKWKIVLFIMIYLLIASFVWLIGHACCEMAIVRCGSGQVYKVPSYFPGAGCCQVCATQSELIIGYILMILQYYILPAIILYILISLIFYIGHRIKNSK